MNLFNKDFELLRELYAAPVKDYYVTFKYYSAGDPDNLKKLEFKQMDSEPFFPRINRFYEFCIQKMENKFIFIDYEIVDCFTQGPRYNIDLENEFKIH